MSQHSHHTVDHASYSLRMKRHAGVHPDDPNRRRDDDDTDSEQDTAFAASSQPVVKAKRRAIVSAPVATGLFAGVNLTTTAAASFVPSSQFSSTFGGAPALAPSSTFAIASSTTTNRGAAGLSAFALPSGTSATSHAANGTRTVEEAMRRLNSSFADWVTKSAANADKSSSDWTPAMQHYMKAVEKLRLTAKPASEVPAGSATGMTHHSAVESAASLPVSFGFSAPSVANESTPAASGGIGTFGGPTNFSFGVSSGAASTSNEAPSAVNHVSSFVLPAADRSSAVISKAPPANDSASAAGSAFNFSFAAPAKQASPDSKEGKPAAPTFQGFVFGAPSKPESPPSVPVPGPLSALNQTASSMPAPAPAPSLPAFSFGASSSGFPGGFSFGASAPAASSTSSEPAKPAAAPVFAFGGAPVAAPASFSFGAAPASAAAATAPAAPFSFGSAASSFTFGAPVASTATSDAPASSEGGDGAGDDGGDEDEPIKLDSSDTVISKLFVPEEKVVLEIEPSRCKRFDGQEKVWRDLDKGCIRVAVNSGTGKARLVFSPSGIPRALVSAYLSKQASFEPANITDKRALIALAAVATTPQTINTPGIVKIVLTVPPAHEAALSKLLKEHCTSK